MLILADDASKFDPSTLSDSEYANYAFIKSYNVNYETHMGEYMSYGLIGASVLYALLRPSDYPYAIMIGSIGGVTLAVDYAYRQKYADMDNGKILPSQVMQEDVEVFNTSRTIVSALYAGFGVYGIASGVINQSSSQIYSGLIIGLLSIPLYMIQSPQEKFLDMMKQRKPQVSFVPKINIVGDNNAYGGAVSIKF